jgi:hypothetical protein
LEGNRLGLRVLMMRRVPTLIKLVHSVLLADLRESVALVGWDWVCGGEDLLASTDVDGAVSASGAYELLDRPAGAVLDEPAHGERGEHDAQVRLDRFA